MMVYTFQNNYYDQSGTLIKQSPCYRFDEAPEEELHAFLQGDKQQCHDERTTLDNIKEQARICLSLKEQGCL